jgi:hypothetical protein
MSARQSFKAVVEGAPGGAIFIPVPFDPDALWGRKPRHHVTGVVGNCKVRGPLSAQHGRYGLRLGPAWVRDSGGVSVGQAVSIALMPEGPQREALDADIVAALDASPQAATFFDGLAQFYRKGYLTWIAGTKKRPEERERRIAEMVRQLEAGVKQRPK